MLFFNTLPRDLFSPGCHSLTWGWHHLSDMLPGFATTFAQEQKTQ
jgi:hypothetical protein